MTYVLGDMGLFWKEGERLSGHYVEWAKAKRNEPAGTAGMKAPEVLNFVLLYSLDYVLCYIFHSYILLACMEKSVVVLKQIFGLGVSL